MYLRRLDISKFRNFDNITLDLEKNEFPSAFSVASANGGGKSTLLQFIFIMLKCFNYPQRYQYLKNLLAEQPTYNAKTSLCKFYISNENLEYEIEFIITSSTEENYDDFTDLLEIQNHLKKMESRANSLSELQSIQRQMRDKNRLSPIMTKKTSNLRRFINTPALLKIVFLWMQEKQIILIYI